MADNTAEFEYQVLTHGFPNEGPARLRTVALRFWDMPDRLRYERRVHPPRIHWYFSTEEGAIAWFEWLEEHHPSHMLPETATCTKPNCKNLGGPCEECNH